MSLKVRKAEPEDIPDIRGLFNSYVTPPKSEYAFQWWNNLPSITFCAVDEREVVGTFIVLRRKLINGLNCGVLMGLLVKDDWRGSGLFKELGDKAMMYFNDLDVFCCLPNWPGKRALEKNFGFRTIGDIITMVKPGTARQKVFNEQNVCNVEAKTEFYNFKIAPDDVLMFFADRDFRLWRFAAHPRHSYQLIRMDSQEYAVIKKYIDNGSETRYGDIVDFETEAMKEENIINVLEGAYAGLSHDVDLVTIQAIPDSLLHAVAKKMGFVESNVRHYFCMNVKDVQNDYLYNSRKWIIKWGDYLR